MYSASPRESPSSARTQHNVVKHPHAVRGEHRAKHQPQQDGAPHTRHMLPQAKGVMHIIGSIRPPCVPKPKTEVVLPSREPAPDFVTYSPFDLRFPPYAPSRATSPKSSAVVKTFAKVAAVASVPSKAKHLTQSKQLKSTKTKSAGLGQSMGGRMSMRLRKEHAHEIPRKVSNKKWHLAGWVTYSPFDSNFDRICYGAHTHANRHHPHAHHPAGRPHHVGHHQAHHPHAEKGRAQRMISDFYNAQPNFMAFPRMSPTAVVGQPAPPMGMSSFFMPMPRLQASGTSASMNGLPGSMRAFAPPSNAQFSSGFAW